MTDKFEMQPGKIYYLSYGGTEIVGRYKGESSCSTKHLFYDYLHQWNGYESFMRDGYCVHSGIVEIREATQTEKQALLRQSIEHNTI